MARTRAVAMSLAILSILALSSFSFAAAPDRISGPIGAGQTVKLGRGMPLQARNAVDHGAVDPALKMPYITMVTVPSPAQQRAAHKLYLDQQNPRSASYHKWLTPEQYGDRFGLSPSDTNKITNWLLAQGFLIVRTARARNFVVFSGSAAQVEKTFQVEIHNFEGKDQKFFAPASAPAIPSALSGIVAGFNGLSNLRPVSQARRAVPGYTYVNSDQNYYFLAPGDITALYDIGTTYTNGYNGTGQSLAVIGETGIYQSDLTNFRQNFGLSAINCTVSSDIITACNTSNFKYVLVNGSATDIYSDLPEADIDIEWSGATAPDAKVIFVNSTDPDGDGVWDSWYYAVDNDVAPVITMSYTAPCELAEAGFTGEGSISGDEGELQTASMEGITFMNSAGDTGSAACDYGANLAQYGYAVSYPASSQFVTGVGGTSIPSTNPGEYTSTYWFASNQNTAGESAKGYIPEQPWNDSQEFGYLCTVGSPCTLNGESVTSWATAQTAIGISAGGGGISNCAYVDENDVCNGGFPQPSWQSGISMSTVSPNGYGITTTPARMVPDVSLLASPNFPGYLVCTQNFNGEGTATGSSCDSPTTGIADMLNGCFAGTGTCSIFGGTSVSSPIFAGIVTLLNQYATTNGLTAPVGNINPTLYTLAASNSSNHAFNSVTTASSGSYSDGAFCEEGTPSSGIGGDPWPTPLVCPSTGSSAGFLGFNSYDADATTSYNLVTGLGSVDVGNLFAAWATAGLSSTTTTIQSSENPSKYGDSVTFTATVTTTGSDTPTGTVVFNDNGTQIGTGTLGCICDGRNGIPLSATATFTTSTLAPGTHPITAVYGGDSNNAGSTSSPALSQVVNAPTFTVTTPSTPAPAPAGASTSSTFTVTATGGATTFAAAVTFACNGLPDATVSCGFSTVAQGASSPQTVTLTINTSGPNGDNARKQQRRRADNRLPLLPMTLPLAGVVMLGFAGRKRSKYSMVAGLCVALVFAGFLIACGSNSTPPTAVSVSPQGATVFASAPAGSTWPPQTAAFTATVTNNSNTAVTWSVTPSSGGTIDANGNYTAPVAVEGLPTSATVTATSQADSTKSASATVTLTPTSVPGTYPLTVTATESTTQNTTGSFNLVVQ
jgi:subtilase family serine protease